MVGRVGNRVLWVGVVGVNVLPPFDGRGRVACVRRGRGTSRAYDIAGDSGAFSTGHTSFTWTEHRTW